MAKENPTWMVSIQTVDDTKAITPEVLESERQEIIQKNGSDAIFQQEYYCSFDKEVLNKQEKVQAHFYNAYGTEVSCNYIQDDERVTVYSRVNAEIIAIFR